MRILLAISFGDIGHSSKLSKQLEHVPPHYRIMLNGTLLGLLHFPQSVWASVSNNGLSIVQGLSNDQKIRLYCQEMCKKIFF